MALQLGSIEEVRVLRQTDIGYMVGDEEEEVLLHYNEVAGEIELDDVIDVFLYADKNERMTATMKTPQATIHDFAWLRVVSVMKNLGVFVDIGIAKDVLIPEDELPGFYGVWPQEGDELYCTLKATRNGRLIAKLARQEDMEELAVGAPESMFNKNTSGRVYRSIRVGSFVLTDEHFLGFIHESQRRDEPRLGERVTGRIIAVKEDGTINMSLLPRKQEGMEEDAARVYAYMEGRGGAMPFWDKSGAEDIQERFSMSKAAFKRALGKLMKEGKVYQEDGWTYFKREEQNPE